MMMNIKSEPFLSPFDKLYPILSLEYMKELIAVLCDCYNNIAI